MLPFTIRVCFVTLFIVFVVSCAYGQDRKITSVLNPGCEGCTNETTLVYIKAEDSHDTVHQIWDFTTGLPTTIFAITGVNSTLTVDWDQTNVRRFNFSQKPRYSFAAVIDKLIEYNDVADAGSFVGHCPHREHSLARLTWRRNATTFKDKEAMVIMHGRFVYGKEEKKMADTIEVKLDLLPYKDYAAELPHLIHTANSTLFDISLVNLTRSERYNSSRFAVHCVLASTDDAGDTMRYMMRKSLDDEHTPGIFEIIEIKTPESYQNNDGGFIQFRPVGYTQPERGVTTSTLAHVSDFNRTSLPRSSTVKTFYRDFDRSNLLVQDITVSFGESGDGFYKQHNYTAWSFTIGYGAPPVEGFSFFVIMVISVGLGVPVLLALSGVVYVVSRRCRQRNARSRLVNEE